MQSRWGLLLNTVKKVACGPFRVWSRLVATLGVPGTSRAPCFGFPECGTPPRPHWDWGRNRRNYTPCECLSPRVNEENRWAPSSSRRRVRSHVQSVKYNPGKPIITTSSPIWHSVVKLVTWRETETVWDEKKNVLFLQLNFSFFPHWMNAVVWLSVGSWL